MPTVYDSCNTAEAVSIYMDTPICLDRPPTKLKDVTVHSFDGSKPELFFIKLLLAHTPSLLRMRIKPDGSLEEWNIATELMRYPRVSPMGELLYSTPSISK